MITLAVLGVVALLLLSGLAKSHHHSRRIYCVNNLKLLGVAFRQWSQDHSERFPMQVSTNEGGTHELVDFAGVVPHLRVLSNEIVATKAFVCLTERTRTWATNFDSDLTPNHISYFVGVDVTSTNSEALLAGDRNITKAKPVWNGIVGLTINTPPEWTKELHDGEGNVLIGDGHVEGMNTASLRKRVATTGFSTNRLAMP
jgi:hypothetical protein